MNFKTLTVCLAACFATACADKANIDIKMAGDPNVSTDPNVDPNGDNPVVPTPDQMACDQGYTYQGFGGTQLEVGRDEDDVGFDRDRLKPLSALRGEYARVLGTMPPLLDSLSNTFGSVPPRWFVEPEANAVSLFSAMRVGFAGCLVLTNSATYDAPPDATNARVKCGEFAHRFWSREAESDELDSCVDLVTTKTASETQARRKWAYACASVLSSASFLSY